MGYRRIPLYLVKFESKLNSGDSFSYFQFGICASLPHTCKAIFYLLMMTLLNDVTMDRHCGVQN